MSLYLGNDLIGNIYVGTSAGGIASITLNNPTITISNTGLITAQVTQATGGILAANSTSLATQQLNTVSGATITPTNTVQTAVTANKYTLGAITVAAVPTEARTITENGIYTPTAGRWFSSVTVNVPTGSSIINQNKTVTPSTSLQTITADNGYTGLGTVTINAIQTETKSATPSTVQQTITPISGKYLTEVTVNAIPSNYIIPSGNKSITANGTNIDVSNYATVSVNVPTQGVSIVDTLDTNGGTIRTITAVEIYGNTYTIDEIVSNNGISGDIVINSSSIRSYCFYGCTGMTSVTANNVTNLGSGKATSIFEGCSNLISINMPNLTSIGNSKYFLSGCSKLTTVYLPKLSNCGDFAFNGCTSLVAVALPSATGSYRAFYGCNKLEKVDYGADGYTASITQENFRGCSKLKTLILRHTSAVATLGSTNVFTSTPFASGGSGGTIYIPEIMYNHLGDGTSLDYKAANNWSTIDGYGTITWAKIEGSQYENYYADGTPI